jgi:hypothetical protein
LTAQGFRSNMGMVPRGSRNSEPRGTKRTRNGDPVAMLSSLRRRGAKGIGRSVEVSFRWQTRSSFEPEGSNDPKGEQDRGSQPECRFERRKRVVGGDLPRPGKPGQGKESRAERSGEADPARQRRSRPGTMNPQRWPGDGQPLRASERPFRDAGFVGNLNRATSGASSRGGQKPLRGATEATQGGF